MKNKLTKTIVMIVFVVFISLFLNINKVSAVDILTSPPSGLSIYDDTSTVCWYENGDGEIQVEVNNSGIGISIHYGPWKNKFIANWEHDKGKNGYVKVGFRGVDFYAENNKMCPTYIALCDYATTNEYYIVNTPEQRRSLKSKCQADAGLPGFSFDYTSLQRVYQVPVEVPEEIIVTDDEPIYECQIVDGKYYDAAGNIVTESAYEESCATPEINEGIVNPLEDNSESYSCGDGYLTDIPGSLLRVTSLLYTLFQVVIPVILVIICSIDLIKAMAGQKEDEIKKGQHLLIKRLIQAIIIFFVFAIVKFLVSVVSQNSSSVIDCVNCFIDGKDSDSCVL